MWCRYFFAIQYIITKYKTISFVFRILDIGFGEFQFPKLSFTMFGESAELYCCHPRVLIIAVPYWQ